MQREKKLFEELAGCPIAGAQGAGDEAGEVGATAPKFCFVFFLCVSNSMIKSGIEDLGFRPDFALNNLSHLSVAASLSGKMSGQTRVLKGPYGSQAVVLGRALLEEIANSRHRPWLLLNALRPRGLATQWPRQHLLASESSVD